MLRLRTFGGLAVDRDGAPVAETADQHKALALLAVVASSGKRGVSRDQLAAWLWPESDSERARGGLSQAVYSLRKQLGEPELFQGTRTLRLNPDAIECDRFEFEAALERGDARSAIAVYAGPFLDGFFVTASAELDHWIENQRVELARRAQSAMESLARDAVARGDVGDAIEWWQHVRSLDPGNSRIARALMSALAQVGDVAGALRIARAHEDHLRREFDVPPDPAVLALAQELRCGIDVPHGPLGSTSRVQRRHSSPSASATVETGSLEPASRRTDGGSGRVRLPVSRIAVLAGVCLGLAGIALLLANQKTSSSTGRISERRIVVAGFDNETGDSALARIGRLASDWVVQGLMQTQVVQVTTLGISESALPAFKTDSIRQRAGLMVRGSYTLARDSIVMQGEVVETSTGRVIRAVGPVSGPRSEPLVAIEQLRQRLTGALATRIDSRLMNWADAASQPTTFEAYRTFQDGLDVFFVSEDSVTYERSARLLVRAGALDSSFTLPLLWAVYAFRNAGDAMRADSILQALAPRRERMPPLDRALLDGHAAWKRRDAEGEYEAFRRLVSSAANSEWLYKLAVASMNTGRYAEADSLMTALDPDAGWMRDWVMYWVVLPRVRYFAGRHDGQIEAAQRGQQHVPQCGCFEYETARAVAAEGREREALSIVDAQLARQDPTIDSEGWFRILSTARLHGHVQLARSMVARALGARLSGVNLGSDSIIARARYETLVLEHAERWDEAEQSATRLLQLESRVHRYDALPHMVLLQAALHRTPVGDTAGLESRAIDAAAKWDWKASGDWMVDTPEMVRAELAAIHHNAEEAGRMLREADDHGLSQIYWLTERAAFDPIRGNPLAPWIHDPRADRPTMRATPRR